MEDTHLPLEHMLRDMNILLEHKGKQGSIARIPVMPSVCNDQGAMYVGVLATLIDVLAATLAQRWVHPDWITTGDLRLYSTQRAEIGEVTAVASVLRDGRASVVIEVDMISGIKNSGEISTSIGAAVVTCSRLPRRDSNVDMGMDSDSYQIITLKTEDSGFYQHLLDKAGLRVIDEALGVVELNMTEYVRNIVGALQGGMCALMADVAGQYAARNVAHKPMITGDIAICYLSQGKIGPFHTKTKVLRVTDNSVLTRVEIIDRGADDLLMSVAMNTAMIL